MEFYRTNKIFITLNWKNLININEKIEDIWNWLKKYKIYKIQLEK